MTRFELFAGIIWPVMVTAVLCAAVLVGDWVEDARKRKAGKETTNG